MLRLLSNPHRERKPDKRRLRTFDFRRRLNFERLEQRWLLANYTWQNVAIGAGGFVDGIVYDPHNQNVIYARTDIGGLYKTTNDGTTWTQLLDFVGQSTSTSGNGTQYQLIGVLGFAIDPENSNNIYADVGEYSGTNGAVFYSTNGGQTWGQTNLSFYVGGNSDGRGDGEQIAVDPNNSNIVYLGSNDHGLWKSTNAGHSFTQISTSLFTPTSTTFVLFDPASGTPGNGSQTIYVGINSASSGTNLYVTTNGGSSWAQVAITSGTGPTGWLPGHAVLSGGNMYLGYANAETPNGTLTGGGVFRYSPSTGAWANITPVVASGWGYDGVAGDPQNPNTIVVTSFGFYGGPDTMWRTINANAASPTWYKPLSIATAQNFGYGSYNQTRDASRAPYAYASGDGIANWAAAVAINPFNSNQLMYGTGEGIWATDNLSNGGANTPLTAAKSWYFPNTGIEFTAVGGVAAGSAGVPLFSAMGDIFGFAHTTLTSSPAQGAANIYGSSNNVDAAGNVIAIVGNPGSSKYGVYSTNDGLTFQTFPTSPGTGNNYGTDTVAVSANGLNIVWAQSGQAPYYTINYGSSWNFSAPFTSTQSITSLTQTSGVATVVTSSPHGFGAGQLVNIAGATQSGYNGNFTIASIVNSTTFTYAVNSSTVSPATGTITATSAGAGLANGKIIADRLNANDFYYRVGNSVYFSSDGGVSFTLKTSSGPSGGSMAVNPFTTGELWIAANNGVYRSTNFGATFTKVSPASVTSTGGIIALGAPAPGQITPAIYSFLTISSFRGVNRSDDGGATWTLLNDTSHQWGGLLQTLAADPNVFGRVYIGINGRGIIMGNPANSLPANWVDTDIYTPGNPGWATNSTTLSNGTTVNQWIVNGGGAGLTGNSLSITSLTDPTPSTGPFYASAVTATPHGLHVGDFVTISGASPAAYNGTFAVSAIVNTTTFRYITSAGLATATGTIKASTNDQFNFAYKPISGNAAVSAQLLSLTNADGGNGTPVAGVMVRGSTNNNDPFVAMVQTAGNSLVFEYRTTTGGSITAVSLGSVPVGSEYVEIVRNGSNFSGYYSSNGTTWTQLGTTIAIAAMPATYNAGLAASANYNAQLTSAKFAQVMVNNAPTIVNAAAATPNPVTGTTSSLSALGTDSAGEANLTYTWSATGPAAVMYSANGTNAAKNTVATFTQAGNYNFTVTVTDAGGLTVTSSISVMVNQTLTAITLTPPSASIFNSQSQQFTATALDQFGNALTVQPTFTWTLDGTPAGSVDSSGLYTASSSAIGPDTVRATSGAVSNTANASVAWLKGDLNGDGQVTTRDVQALMFALSDVTGYQTQRGVGITDMPFIADVNTDGRIDNRDIQSLIALIANNAPGGGGGSSSADGGTVIAESVELGVTIGAKEQVNNGTTAGNPSTTVLTDIRSNSALQPPAPASILTDSISRLTELPTPMESTFGRLIPASTIPRSAFNLAEALSTTIESMQLPSTAFVAKSANNPTLPVLSGLALISTSAVDRVIAERDLNSTLNRCNWQSGEVSNFLDVHRLFDPQVIDLVELERIDL